MSVWHRLFEVRKYWAWEAQNLRSYLRCVICERNKEMRAYFWHHDRRSLVCKGPMVFFHVHTLSLDAKSYDIDDYFMMSDDPIPTIDSDGTRNP